MDLSAIIKAVLAPHTEKGSQTLRNLQPGDKLAGKVLQLESDGRVLVDLGGSRILAQVGFAVKPGQTLKLTVVEKGPLLHLRANLPADHPMQNIAAQTKTIRAETVPQADRGNQSIPDLQPGDKLAGKVVQVGNDGRVLIDLGGSRVLARVGFAVKPGQTLKLTVVEKGPLLHLRVDLPADHLKQDILQAKIIKAEPVPRVDRGSQSPLDLQPGDKLTGKVVQSGNDGRVLIDLGGSRVLARVGFAVQQGQTLKFTVEESGLQLHFKVDLPADQARQSSASQANLPAALNSGEGRELIRTIEGILPRLAIQGAQSAMARTIFNALSQIKTAFDPLPVEKTTVEIAQWLRNAMENHGGLFEKRLADIEQGGPKPGMETMAAAGRESATSVRAVITRDVKPQLIILKNFLEGDDASQRLALKFADKETALLRDSVEKMLHHLEQQQERAVVRSRQGEPFQMFSHLLPMPEGRSSVQLKVYYPRKDGQGAADPSHRIALLLDMDRLGMVRGDIAKMADTLQIHFFVQDGGVRDYFKTQLGEIEAALTGSFDQVSVDVSVSKKKIAQFHHEDKQGTAPGRIDIKA